MKSMHSSVRTSGGVPRRGYTLVEALVAAGLLAIVAAASTSMLVMIARMTESTRLRGTTGESAALAMNWMIQDLQEAASASLPQSYQLRIFYPSLDAAGYYDRFVVDTSSWVEFVRADAAGVPSPSGGYLFRKTNSGSSRRICSDVSSFTATLVTANAVRLTLQVRRTHGSQSSTVTVSQRVVFLRNR